MRYVHTCYRVLDLEKSIDFYTNKLGLELARKTPVGDDATNAFFAVPGDSEPRLELTLNHGQEEPYELGSGYSHVAFAVEDLDALADRLEEAGGVEFESKPHAMGSGDSAKADPYPRRQVGRVRDTIENRSRLRG